MSSPKKPLDKGKGKVWTRETIILDDSDDDESWQVPQLQQMIEHSIVAHPPRAGSTLTATVSTTSSKKHSREVSVDSDSDLEPLTFAGPSSAAWTPKSTRGGKQPRQKKPRIEEKNSMSSSRLGRPLVGSSSSSTATAIRALDASVDALLKSYASKRTTRPAYISQKLAIRDEAKQLGVDFEKTYGPRFDEVEDRLDTGHNGVRRSANPKRADKLSGNHVAARKDIKGKGKAPIEYDDEPPREEEDDGMIDRRMTAAQVRAQEGRGLAGRRKGPLPNAEIIATKKKEWEQARIVPLTFGTVLERSGAGASGTRALGINKEALQRAKRRTIEREAKRRRQARTTGGIDGWIEGAAAGPRAGTAVGKKDGVPLPGGWGVVAQQDNSDSDSSFDDGSSSEDEKPGLNPGVGGFEGLVNMIRSGIKTRSSKKKENPPGSIANQEMALFMRRNQNALMRSTKAVDDAVAALGMKEQTDRIPGMKYPLLAFQWIGLEFMVKREMDSKVSGGILADEMGLGKTFQTIALMLARRSHDPEIKTNLVVVPLSLISQWEKEIEKFAIGQSVHIYHGSNKYKAKSKEELVQFDVVITTHSTLCLEWPKSKKKKKKKDGEAQEEEEDEEPQEKKEPGLLFQFCWYRVVIDEAHVARNPRSRISKAIARLDAVFRWALTGTPMINTLQDYYPLHRFLRNRTWKDYSYYRKAITNVEKNQPVEAGRLADAAIGPLLLRRRKADELGGKPLVPLPRKTETRINLTFDPIEREIYDHIEAGYQTEVNKFFRQGTLLKNFHFILVLILRLKQLTCHPHLITEKLGDYDRKVELEKARAVLGEAVVKRLQRQRLEVAVQRAGADDLEDPTYDDKGTCPVCNELIVGAPGEGSVTPCGHICCTTCIHEILNQDPEDDFDRPKNKKGEAPCPLCRAPFSAKSLFDLECFEPDPDELASAIDAQEDNQVKLERHVDVKPRAQGGAAIIELSDDDEGDDELPDPSMLFDLSAKIKPEISDVKPKLGRARRVKKEEKDLKPRPSSATPTVQDSKPRIGSPASQARSRAPSSTADGRKVKAEAGEEDLHMSPLVPSTKMVYILKKLRQYEAEDRQKLKELEARKRQVKLDDDSDGEEEDKLDEPEPDTRTIILSQFVAALDLLDRYLTQNGVMSVRFQGSSSAEERSEAIDLLNKKGDGGVKVMLLSTKAGGVGLNLTAACRVLSFDLAWSKAVEAQAFDRTYRLGQTREVEIERLIINDTIEERILNLQARKTLLSDMSLAEGQGDPEYVGNISVPDILSLFRLDMNGNREDGRGSTPARGGVAPRGRGRGGRRFGSP